jgi:hypothetical protein
VLGNVIGRVYKWRGRYWVVLARGEPFDRGPRRNVLLQRVLPVEEASAETIESGGRNWFPVDERVVRPFRGLRRSDCPPTDSR